MPQAAFPTSLTLALPPLLRLLLPLLYCYWPPLVLVAQLPLPPMPPPLLVLLLLLHANAVGLCIAASASCTSAAG